MKCEASRHAGDVVEVERAEDAAGGCNDIECVVECGDVRHAGRNLVDIDVEIAVDLGNTRHRKPVELIEKLSSKLDEQLAGVGLLIIFYGDGTDAVEIAGAKCAFVID